MANLIGADIHNVYRLIPSLPERRPGDTIWMGPREKFKGMARMIVAKIVPHRAPDRRFPGRLIEVARWERGS